MNKYLKFIYRYWMKFVHVLGEVNAWIILTVFFIFILGLYAVVLKFVRFFHRRTASQTYWIKKPHQQPTVELLRRQF